MSLIKIHFPDFQRITRNSKFAGGDGVIPEQNLHPISYFDFDDLSPVLCPAWHVVCNRRPRCSG